MNTAGTTEVRVAKLIGGAGTGKTTELMRIMDQVLEQVRDPFRVGFVSFTRAARREAAKRAANRYRTSVTELEEEGWFRTLHSICYHMLGVRKEDLVADDPKSRDWMQNALQEEVQIAERDDDGFVDPFCHSATPADIALALWSAARSRMVPLSVVWAEARECSEQTPDLDYCYGVVERYEQAKRLDHRVDFTDLLSRFAGYKLTIHGVEETSPDGLVPDLPVWFFDEQQDTSKLLDAVCKRLAGADGVKWVYLAGDPFQAIYNWAGSDQRYFLEWHADKTRVMPKSWRCPPEILTLGENILRECSDYWDRGIQPADREGVVETWNDSYEYLLDEVKPTDSWLILARSRFYAGQLGAKLSSLAIPWLPTKGECFWSDPTRVGTVKTLLNMKQGYVIVGSEWRTAVEAVPSRYKGQTLLREGTKAIFKHMTNGEADKAFGIVPPEKWEVLGITPALAELIHTGEWEGWVPHASTFVEAVQRWGIGAVENPRIRVGTIHSTKGAEADNVLLLTTISNPVRRGMETVQGFDAEQRVWYVGATRARQRLAIINQHDHPDSIWLPDGVTADQMGSTACVAN